MEDFQEQEYEFLRRLEEERFDRGKLLKRGLATAVGLTVISLPEAALAARAKALADPPLRGTKQNLSALVAAAKKEGHLNVIALPPDWANYGEIISTFTKKYGIGDHERQPQRLLVGGEPGDRLAQGRPSRTRRRRRQPDVRGRRHRRGPVRQVLRQHLPDRPAGDEGHPRPLDGRLLRLGHDRLQREPREDAAEVVRRPAEADLQEPGRAEREPAQVRLGDRRACSRRRSRTAARSRTSAPGSTGSRRPGQLGNYIPVQTTPQTVASGQTPISIDWDYNNFAYVKEFPSANWKVILPTDGQYGELLLPGGQRHGAAPVGRPSVAGVPLLRPGADPLPEGLCASRPLCRPRSRGRRSRSR